MGRAGSGLTPTRHRPKHNGLRNNEDQASTQTLPSSLATYFFFLSLSTMKGKQVLREREALGLLNVEGIASQPRPRVSET